MVYAHNTIKRYAEHPDSSKGRLYQEINCQNRPCFQRDRDRVVHSRAFRRLQYKTQVFVFHEGDHFRNRLTHSIEVSQIARSISRKLGFNEDLAETISLSHDLGHTPFGHAGEDALKEKMKDYGGFNHNIQSVKILTFLENHYAEFLGLNLTWESLEGVIKHNGLLELDKRDELLANLIPAYKDKWDFMLDKFPSGEAQIASLSDDIAYNCHDIDDGLRAGLFDFKDIEEIPIVNHVAKIVDQSYTGITNHQRRNEIIRRLVNIFVQDLISQSFKNLETYNPQSPNDIRELECNIIDFSTDIKKSKSEVKNFLRENMYSHFRLERMCFKANHIIGKLFKLFFDNVTCLPAEWQLKIKDKTPKTKAHIVSDYIAGMTDRYAQEEYHKMFESFGRP